MGKRHVCSSRDKSLHCRQTRSASRRDRVGQRLQTPDAGSDRRVVSEHHSCGRGRKKRNCMMVGSPSLDIRSRLALHTGCDAQHRYSSKLSRKRNFDMPRESRQGLRSRSGTSSSPAGRTKSRGTKKNFAEPTPADMPSFVPPYPEVDAGATFQGPGGWSKNRQTFTSSGGVGTSYRKYNLGGSSGDVSSKSHYASKKPGASTAAAMTSYLTSRYTMPQRSLKSIMAEYTTQPSRFKSERFNSGESPGFNSRYNESSSNSLGFRGEPISSSNITHNSNSYAGRLMHGDADPIPFTSTFRSSYPRPSSAGRYESAGGSGYKRFSDYRDDMSTIALNPARHIKAAFSSPCDFTSGPDCTRKPFDPRFDPLLRNSERNNYVSDDLDAYMKSHRFTSGLNGGSQCHGGYNGCTSSYNPPTGGNRRFDSAWSCNNAALGDSQYDNQCSSSSYCNYGPRFMDSTAGSNHMRGGASRSLCYEGSHTPQIPCRRDDMASIIGQNLQSEKERLTRITNIIGTSTFVKKPYY